MENILFKNENLATVITNLFSAVPYIGPSIVEWLWGGFSVQISAAQNCEILMKTQLYAGIS